MRFVVYGAGSVGGVVGGRLAEQGHDVALIARGAHYHAIRERGLRIESPGGPSQIALPIHDHPSTITWTPHDVVLLAVKTQDTPAALQALAACAPPSVPIACLQNGVANERMALRCFEHVYGVYVWCPASHLTPGVVQVWFGPKPGVLDVGRYPSGTDEVAADMSAAFQSATFFSTPRADIMRWKYRKLLSNLGNAVEALCGADGLESRTLEQAKAEAQRCFDAAGIEVAGKDEDMATREWTLSPQAIEGRERPGGSSWQSLARGTHSIEADYLNGEVVLLGRLHGVPVPANALLQRLARDAAARGVPPGSMSVSALDAQLAR